MSETRVQRQIQVPKPYCKSWKIDQAARQSNPRRAGLGSRPVHADGEHFFSFRPFSSISSSDVQNIKSSILHSFVQLAVGVFQISSVFYACIRRYFQRRFATNMFILRKNPLQETKIHGFNDDSARWVWSQQAYVC